MFVNNISSVVEEMQSDYTVKEAGANFHSEV